jgi:diguanylate cyclase (GGDEF)-like protein
MTKERADALNVVLAMRDELTQLYNRRAVFEALAQHLAAARRNQMPLSVLMLDVDNFKSLNDTFGHAAGDRVLREIASTIQNGLRAQDVAGRIGGEEFLALLPHATADEASRTAERLRQLIQDVDCLRRCNLKTTLSVSVGVAQFDPVRHAGGDELIQEADQALYLAKARGRNRVELSAHSASADTVVLA